MTEVFAIDSSLVREDGPARPLQGLRIGLLTGNASRLGGGVFEAVVTQADLLRRLGAEAPVFALDDPHADEDRGRFGDSAVTTTRVLGPRQIGFAPSLGQVLDQAELDCLHLHGIWLYTSRAGVNWARRSGKPYVISPHGMLDRWIVARGRVKKAVAREAFERASWRAASIIHALTGQEADDVAQQTGRADCTVIPNAAPPLAARAEPGDRQILYLGRIHPKKNLAALIAAWRGLPVPRASDAKSKLVIAGWGEPAHMADLQAHLSGAPDTVAFVGSVFGVEKQRLLSQSRFVILPSLSEGLPMAILEAWAAGTPTIMTEVCHLPEGFAAGAAIACGSSPASIAAALQRALSLAPGEWQAMSAAAQALAGGPFGEATVARRWAELYRRAIANHSPPAR